MPEAATDTNAQEVDRRPSTYTEIVASDLETIGNGLYRMRGRVKVDDYYNPAIDVFEHDVPLVLMCRVDDGVELPLAVEKAYIRPDGKRVIVAWVKDIA